MIDSHRLAPLLRRAEHHKTTAARQLAERQRQLQVNEQRLEELGRYAAEYAATPARCVTIGQLRSQHAFVGRLLGAVEQQRQHVDQTRQHVEHERQGLIDASRQQQVLEHLDSLSRTTEQIAEQRKLQREMDDLGARIARRHAEGHTGGHE